MVLEENWKDQLERSCEEWRHITCNQWGKVYILHTVKRRKADWLVTSSVGSAFQTMSLKWR